MDDQPTPDVTRREGVRAFPVTLSDGNDWGLALPSTRLRPRVELGVDVLGRPTEIIRVEAEFGYPIEIRRLVDDLRSACEGDEEEPRYDTLFRLAATLIRRAHDIDLATAASLLELDVDDLPRLVEVVLSVVTGECLENPASPRKANVDV
jgi:hypothetical protein